MLIYDDPIPPQVYNIFKQGLKKKPIPEGRLIMKINWKVLLQSYPFWVALVGFVGLIVNNSGLIDSVEYNNYVDAFMLVLVADPTTQGVFHSKQAERYDKSKEK